LTSRRGGGPSRINYVAERILPSSSTSDKKIQPDHQEIDGVPRSYRNRIRRATNRSRCQGLANVVAPDRLLDRARGVGRLYGAYLDGGRAADAGDRPAGKF